MESFMALIIGCLFAAGTYLILSKTLIRIILGTNLITHAAHLLLLTMAGLKRGGPPLVSDEAIQYTDPLPQALILTSIVISFGVTSFFLVLAYRTYKSLGTDDMEQMREADYE